jgi:hypothetical protein
MNARKEFRVTAETSPRRGTFEPPEGPIADAWVSNPGVYTCNVVEREPPRDPVIWIVEGGLTTAYQRVRERKVGFRIE